MWEGTPTALRALTRPRHTHAHGKTRVAISGADMQDQGHAPGTDTQAESHSLARHPVALWRVSMIVSG